MLEKKKQQLLYGKPPRTALIRLTDRADRVEIVVAVAEQKLNEDGEYEFVFVTLF